MELRRRRAQGFRGNIREYLRILLKQQAIIWTEGALRKESSSENLKSDLVKSFNPNRKEIRVPEYRRGIKEPNTTQWRRGPVSHTAMLVKHFFKD